MQSLQVDILRPEHLDEWLRFFDRDAFADNPAWSTCYCRCLVFGGGGYEAWDQACAAGANRAPMCDAIRAGAIDGVIARRDGQMVGWIHFGPSTRFHSPGGRWEPRTDDLASVVCFVVAAGHRRSGVARALLRAAVAEAERRGFAKIDARAQLDVSADAAHQFQGPLSLYLSEGFARDPASERRVVKELKAG